MYRYIRGGLLPSRTVQGCTGIPGLEEQPSRTVQGCTGKPGVGQLPSRTGTGLYIYTRGAERYRAVPSRTVQGCTFIPGVGQLPSRSGIQELLNSTVYRYTRGRAIGTVQGYTGTEVGSYRAEQYRAVQIPGRQQPRVGQLPGVRQSRTVQGCIPQG